MKTESMSKFDRPLSESLEIQNKFFTLDVTEQKLTRLYLDVKKLTKHINKENYTELNEELYNIVSSYIKLTAEFIKTKDSIRNVKTNESADRFVSSSLEDIINISQKNMDGLIIKLSTLTENINIDAIQNSRFVRHKIEEDESDIINVISYQKISNELDQVLKDYMVEKIPTLLALSMLGCLFYSGKFFDIVSNLAGASIVIADKATQLDLTTLFSTDDIKPSPRAVHMLYGIQSIVQGIVSVSALAIVASIAIRTCADMFYLLNLSQFEFVAIKLTKYIFIDNLKSMFEDDLCLKRQHISVAKDILVQLNAIHQFKDNKELSKLQYILQLDDNNTLNIKDILAISYVEEIASLINNRYGKDFALVSELLESNKISNNIEFETVKSNFNHYSNKATKHGLNPI